MPEIQTEFLFTINLDFEFSVLGDTPYGIRRIARLKTGSFEGLKLKGTVLPGGGAWTLVRRDDVLDIEVRLVLETSDKHQIYMHWKALRDVSKDVADRLRRGETVSRHLLYPRYTVFRDKLREVRLDEPHLWGCVRLTRDERTNARCFSGVVADRSAYSRLRPTTFGASMNCTHFGV